MMAGKLIVRINALLTLIFVVTSVVSAVVFSQPWKTIAVVVSLVCFAVGITVFLWGYWSAVQRSRQDNISVAAMYFLIDGAAPSRLALVMNSTLAIQVVVAVATAVSRSSTDGRWGWGLTDSGRQNMVFSTLVEWKVQTRCHKQRL